MKVEVKGRERGEGEGERGWGEGERERECAYNEMGYASFLMFIISSLSDEVPVTVTPPPQVLNSIRTAKKHKHSLKTGNKAPPFTRQAPPLKQVITPVQLVRKSGNHVDLASGSQPVAPPPPPPPPPPLPVVTKLQKAKSDGGSIPPPPPLPQVVAQPQMQRSISQIGRQRRMVEQIRTSGRKMVSKLRPVETIEKSAFRVGK